MQDTQTKLQQDFWQAYERFLKAGLVTEAPNPKTAHLSDLAQKALPQAYEILRELDLHVIDYVAQQTEAIKNLQVLCSNAKRVILVGCGASGRIAAQVEYWCEQSRRGGMVRAILAGGDITLIEAIESCEDNPEFARQQMALVNLGKDDVVIGLSAGGESPFILEALRFAQDKTSAKPILICCNPIQALVERDAHHPVGDSRFETIALVVGEMALTGSTRMQATTAMTLLLILVLIPEQFNLAAWRESYRQVDFQAFCGLTIWEAERFQKDERITYHADSSMALPILADLTERAPTFNIQNLLHASLILDDTKDARDAWQKLLGRSPMALNFESFPKTTMDYLLTFDLSTKAEDSFYKVSLKKAYPEYFDLSRRPGVTAVERDFLLRLILVNHSTLVMGRLGFYTGNLMTSVKPANFKLMDRTIRYVQFLAEQQTGAKPDYKIVANQLFELMPNLQPGESIVYRILAAL